MITQLQSAVVSVCVLQMALDSSPDRTLTILKTALKKKDGTIAISVVSSRTIENYENARRRALSLSIAEIEKLPIVDCMQVLSLRVQFSKTDLESKSGKSLLKEAFSSSLASETAFADIEIDDVKYDRKDASAVLKAKGQVLSGVIMRFRLEDNVWKMDLDDYMRQGSERLEAVRLKKKQGRVDFTLEILRSQYGAKVDAGLSNHPR